MNNLVFEGNRLWEEGVRRRGLIPQMFVSSPSTLRKPLPSNARWSSLSSRAKPGAVPYRWSARPPQCLISKKICALDFRNSPLAGHHAYLRTPSVFQLLVLLIACSNPPKLLFVKFIVVLGRNRHSPFTAFWFYLALSFHDLFAHLNVISLFSLFFTLFSCRVDFVIYCD